MRRIIIVTLLLSFLCPVSSQQLPMYSQYMMNRFLLNPAVAGYDGLTTVNLMAREQWMGLPHSPKTVALSTDIRFVKTPTSRPWLPRKRKITNMFRSGNVALGGYIYNDKSGLIDRTGMQVTYAHHIWMRDHQLSFGISLTGFQMKLDQKRMELENDYDPLMGLFNKALFVPDVNSGVHLWGPSYYLGLSSTQMLQSALKFGHDGLQEFRMERVFYLMGGYMVELENDVTVEPSFLVQSSLKSSYQFDLGAKFYYSSQYWGGISYRSAGAVVFMVGFRYENFHFGYAYDYSVNNMSRQNFGSHELLLSLRFGDSERRYRWLQRY
jgi:type IX secretion system PorP/SprF family membrane protein